VILYEMLTGRPPHHSPTPIETLTLVRQREPVAPRQLQPKVPRSLETIALTCLRKDPTKRYSDAKALADDLERFLSGNLILTPRISVPEVVYGWAKRPRGLVGLVAFITISWLAAFRVFTWRDGATPHRSHSELRRMNLTLPHATTVHEPETIIQADGSIRMGAASAIIQGDSLRFETPFGNLGFWHSCDDRAVWSFRVEEPATFILSLDYSCPDALAGNSFEVRVGDIMVRGVVPSTGAFSTYRLRPIGELTLPAGTHRLEILAVGPIRGALFDLRAVTLVRRHD
jgi:serine/threonine-protein kinase